MVCIGELQCPRPPDDLAEFLDVARRLRTGTIHDAIKNARPAGIPQRFGFPESAWRHYETVADFPQGLIPIGDAICRFNPVYGQGMSVAAREASLLADLLRRRARDAEGLAGLPQDFLAEVQPWIGSGLPADLRRTPGRSRAHAQLRICPVSGRGSRSRCPQAPGRGPPPRTVERRPARTGCRRPGEGGDGASIASG
jgi:hypothetical protein